MNTESPNASIPWWSAPSTPDVTIEHIKEGVIEEIIKPVLPPNWSMMT